MAKKQAANNAPLAKHMRSGTTGIPSLLPPSPEEMTIEAEPEMPADAPPEEIIVVECKTAVIEVPLHGEYKIGPSHVDAQLDRTQATILRRIQSALDLGNHRMANGRHVHSRADAVRWVLEQIGLPD